MRNASISVTLVTARRSWMALVAIAVLAACGGSGATALRDTAWELESLAGNDVLPGTTITLEFAVDQVSGSAGCNHYGGSYKTSGNSLSISDVFATEMGCLEPEGILEQETAYLTALRTAATYQIAADRLEVFDKAGAQILVFVASSSEVLVVATPTLEQPGPAPPTPTSEVLEVAPSPAIEPPAGFKQYQDSVVGVSVFVPESWAVTWVVPGQSAILQSYPEDKYIGGEGFEPGDTKCDLTIRPPDIGVIDFVQQLKSDPTITIVSEQEIVLQSAKTGTRIEAESMGRSISLITEVNERTVVLVCFGELAPFDEIAITLSANE